MVSINFDEMEKRGVEFYAVNQNFPDESEDNEDHHYSRKLKVEMFIDDRNVGGLPEKMNLQIVVFYGSNAWAYTRLGHVDQPQKVMEELLGHGDVAITIEQE